MKREKKEWTQQLKRIWEKDIHNNINVSKWKNLVCLFVYRATNPIRSWKVVGDELLDELLLLVLLRNMLEATTRAFSIRRRSSNRRLDKSRYSALRLPPPVLLRWLYDNDDELRLRSCIMSTPEWTCDDADVGPDGGTSCAPWWRPWPLLLLLWWWYIWLLWWLWWWWWWLWWLLLLLDDDCCLAARPPPPPPPLFSAPL